jgi:four helix bundle protein
MSSESPMDFIHKLAIGQKELGETQYWLELLFKTEYISEAEFTTIYNDRAEVMKIIRFQLLQKRKT